MRIIEDEVIGELRYLVVEFDQTELVTGGMGVISQDAVKRYFIEKRPDLKVKKCGGLKLDSQRDIVTMRIGVVNQSEKLAAALDSIATGIAPEHNEQKLLQPGYDEIGAKCATFQREYDAIVVLYDKLEIRYSKLIKKYDALVKGKDELHAGYGYDRVVEGARKDDIEFHKLQKKYNAGVLLRNKLIDDLDETNKQVLKLQRENDRLVYFLVKLEDSADLIAAKEAVVEDSAIGLDVVEGEINNG